MHTKTPWELVPQNGAGPILARRYETGKQMNPTGLRIIAQIFERGSSLNEDQANAAHIVRCVNSHDALVAALEKSIRHIEQVCSTANTLSNQLGLGYKVHAPDFTESARAALSLAKGE